MTYNEIISARRGECQHSNNSYDSAVNQYICNDCNWGIKDKIPTDYSGDFAAWTPELYEWVEKQGFEDRYIDHLYNVIGSPYCKTNDWYDHWKAHTATPKQKAHALARAIKEES